MSSHPDRRAPTLAQLGAATGDGEPPGAGSADARIDLKLMIARAERALQLSERARARLAALLPDAHPDLWAGTVQDGTARGFLAALEEAISLAPPPAPAPPPMLDPLQVRTFVGKELRKKKDILVASAGARIRFSRKEGVQLVLRDAEVNSTNCLRFEAQQDVGTLDGFAARPEQRPRLFSAQFLQPTVLRQGPDFDQLVLQGRLGRTAAGFPVQLTFTGNKAEPFVSLRIRLDNQQQDHRLRLRLLGVPAPCVQHACTDVGQWVDSPAGGFLAFTLVRACGRLLVDGEVVPVPGAQCRGVLEHEFRFGQFAATPAADG